MRSRSRATVVTAIVLVIVGASFDAAQAGELERGYELLGEEKYKRAVKAFQKANDAAGGSSGPALLGLAITHNRWGRHEDASGYAQQVIALSEDDTERTRARMELAYATVFGDLGDGGDGTSGAISEARRLLARTPDGEASDSLRQALCAVRREARLGTPDGGVAPILFDREDSTVVPPRKIHFPAPFPSHRERELLGRERHMVETLLLIDTDGCVSGIDVLSSDNPDWARIAARGLLGWVFQPAERLGKPVAVWYRLSTTYSTH